MDDVVTILKTETAAATPHRAFPRRQIAAAVMGNALEFYDFTTYTLFAVQLGRTFFPVHSAFENLMLSLLTFAVGFIGRPLGAAVIGAIGDRKGRRPAMLLSFILMGVAILGLVLIPPYSLIGPAAPLLLVICRLTQGFALGGEVGPTTAFLIEAAPPGRRGLIGAWQSASQSLASLIGAAVGLLLSNLLTGPQLESFGWRIAFGIGALVLPFGLALRKGLPETLHKSEVHSPPAPVNWPWWATVHLRPMLLGLGMIMSFTTSTYVLLYMTTFASQTLHMGPAASFGASVANGLCGVAFALLGGALSDRFGRKRVMITARVLFLLCVLPAFSIMVRNRDATSLIVATGVMSALSSTSVGVAIVSLTESLRKDVRSTGLALIYAVGVAVFGGIAQPSVTWMIQASGSPMAPAWYMMAAAGVGILAMSAMKETHPSRIRGAVALIETG
jgi:MFS transporter, MHS family, citrate/tricarballylate:H+ symporter